MKKAFFLIGLILLSSISASAESLDRRVNRLENALAGMATGSSRHRKYDGVVPERTIVYKTTNTCKKIKKTKMYFDAVHPFQIIARVNCANKTYLVVQWWEKDDDPTINVNTVLQDDVVLSRTLRN